MILITEIGITASAAGVSGSEILPYAGICEYYNCGEFAVYSGYRNYCYACC